MPTDPKVTTDQLLEKKKKIKACLFVSFKLLPYQQRH